MDWLGVTVVEDASVTVWSVSSPGEADAVEMSGGLRRRPGPVELLSSLLLLKIQPLYPLRHGCLGVGDRMKARSFNHVHTDAGLTMVFRNTRLVR